MYPKHLYEVDQPNVAISQIYHYAKRSCLSVESPVADGFGDVVGADVVGVFEVGDGAGDFADFVVGAGAEGELAHRVFEHLFAGLVQPAEILDISMRHCGVGHQAAVAKAGGLAGAGGLDHLP